MNEYSAWQRSLPEHYTQKALLGLGFSPSSKGYKYLSDAILMLFEDEGRIYGVTKVLYPTIAKKYDSTPCSVERAIRSAIERAWNKPAASPLQKHYPYKTEKPTNREFIANTYLEVRIAVSEEKARAVMSQRLQPSAQ